MLCEAVIQAVILICLETIFIFSQSVPILKVTESQSVCCFSVVFFVSAIFSDMLNSIVMENWHSFVYSAALTYWTITGQGHYGCYKFIVNFQFIGFLVNNFTVLIHSYSSHQCGVCLQLCPTRKL